ncbi:glycosyltransferase [Erysipelothrix rhusiopathiae]|uniref:Glycosyltransferase n=1 Tax=Erysipelothrix rhusiopathiae TaxID=1648 RepID=A0A6S6I774_ERYRH|nr:glycosyltransferase [Erysipelothrix rhusiopathiae]
MKNLLKKDRLLFIIAFIYIFQIVNRELKFIVDVRYINTILMLLVLLGTKKSFKLLLGNYSGVIFLAFNFWAFLSTARLFLGSNYSSVGANLTIKVLILYLYNFLFVVTLYLNRDYFTFKKVYSILCFSYGINFIASIYLVYVIKFSGTNLSNFIMPFSNIRGFIFGKEHYNFWGGNFRIAGYSEDANYLALNSLIMIVFSIKSIWSKSTIRNKNIPIFMIVISSIMLMFAASKTIVLASFISLILIAISIKFNKSFIFKIIFVILIFSMLVAFNKEYFNLGPSMTNRLYLWNRSLSLFKSNPLIGGGLTSIRHLGFQLGWVVHSHSTYIQVISELGLMGFILFVSLTSTQLESIKDNYFKYLSYVFLITCSTLDLSYTNFWVLFVYLLPIIDMNEGINENNNVVFQLSNGLSNGGAERVAYDLSYGLGTPSENREVYLILTDPEDDHNKLDNQFELEGMNFNVIRLSEKKHDFIRNNFRILKLIKKHNPTIIHTHQITLAYCIFGYFFGGVNCKVHTVHNDSHEEFGSRLFRQIYHMLFIIFRINLVSISDYILETSKKEYRYLCNSKHYMVYNGRSIETLSYEKKDEVFNIVMIGRLTSVKNHIAAVHVMNLVVNSHKRTDVRLQIYGEGPLREYLLEEISKYNLNEYIDLCGISTNISKVLSEQDLFLMTSVHEGFPISAIEAITMGLPVILSEFGSSYEIVEGNGFVIPRDNHEKIALEIINLKENNEIYCQYSIRSKEISMKFTLEYMIDNYSELYNRIIKEELL